MGINGKVVECESLKTGERFALKILRDVPRAKQEAELHFLARDHPNIVRIHDVYENNYNDIACLFLIMECMSGGELFTRIQVRIFWKIILFLRKELLRHLQNEKRLM